MNAVQALDRARALAEQAAPLRLKHIPGALLLLGRVAEGEPYIARAVVANVPVESSDLGLVLLRFSRAQDALAMSLDGWIVARVAPGSRLVGPAPGDIDLARRRLAELNLDRSVG